VEVDAASLRFGEADNGLEQRHSRQNLNFLST
jgi:hypothetical protein